MHSHCVEIIGRSDSGGTQTPSNAWLSAKDEHHDKDHDEDKEQNLRNVFRTGGNVGKAEDRRDDCDDQKDDSVAKHDEILLRTVSLGNFAVFC
jgi:hypothetical protein